MKPICLFFQIHQPIRLRSYRFFDIGVNHDYYDDFLNKNTIRRIGYNCYIPMNNLLMNMIAKYGDNIKISFSISGTTIEQLKWFAPDVLDSFKKLINTGNINILSQPYNFSFSSIADKKLFKEQVKKEDEIIFETFGIKPKAFKNTELLYNDDISNTLLDLGYDTIIIEGARHLLGWKRAENVYCSTTNPHLKLLTRNSALCDDISFRFNDRSWDQWPLTALKYFDWIKKSINKGKCLTLSIEYETFGEYYTVDTGIFDFMHDLLNRIVTSNEVYLATPTEISSNIAPAGQLNVPYNMTWADEEKDTSAWLGNELQTEAFKQLYSMIDDIHKCNDSEIKKDFMFIQSVDNLLYMCTKLFVVKDAIHHIKSTYSSPYNAFINYMNVISDLQYRLKHINLQNLNTKNVINNKSENINQKEFNISWKNIIHFSPNIIKKILRNLSDDNIIFLLNFFRGKEHKMIMEYLSSSRQNRLKALAKITDVNTSNIQSVHKEIERTIFEIINK